MPRCNNEVLSLAGCLERGLFLILCLPSSQSFPAFCSGVLPKPQGAPAQYQFIERDDGAIPCTRVSALFSLASSLLARSQQKQNKGYGLPSSQVWSGVGVGLAFSPGSSATASLLVPVLRNEVTNHSQAEEVLRISPDMKQNKNRSVWFARQTDPVW